MERVKNIIDTSLMGFVMQAQELIQQGYEFTYDDPPGMWGVAYEGRLYYNEERAALFLPKGPVMSRAEILEKARAAKAERRATQQ